ncbi:hypothetical protein PV416_45550 [Streptomyces ipomoeae]|uniref:Uncharacterized protein n=1 Tax=Streptomyces ipomoeae 91-03 TaxID=698759 RepID=L1KQD1_9ACTN|nr:hypothetical protein [Streptomyces ipomoeae]EKX62787.1 hypothetical protein STRIP9103_04624 [Streptomyces ipomoeae 91-03]MDX2700479.1 hypothetical protein [Streptomyces ipomoeae]MDX2828128.1 hypothetical protein [Streptomyces ipomoeae]MDX2844614.1 hypothetical protein [Streptomyces ipomoeae]MDX2880639.1 hypothetical protein [Streptomyces ipomoeae]
MPSDPYTVLRALLRAEAVRSTPKPKPERNPEAGHEPRTGGQQPPKTSEHD